MASSPEATIHEIFEGRENDVAKARDALVQSLFTDLHTAVEEKQGTSFVFEGYQLAKAALLGLTLSDLAVIERGIVRCITLDELDAKVRDRMEGLNHQRLADYVGFGAINSILYELRESGSGGAELSQQLGEYMGTQNVLSWELFDQIETALQRTGYNTEPDLQLHRALLYTATLVFVGSPQPA
jgi:hypothetical protein